MPDEELARRAKDFANQTPNFQPSVIEAVNASYAGDHGKFKHRFGSKTIFRWRDEKNEKRKSVVIYPLADISCRKDTGEVFKGTVQKKLAAGINRVCNGKLLFEKDDKSGIWECSVITSEHPQYNSNLPNTVECQAFMVGDLKFLLMMLGKEDFDSYWCYLCSLCHREWQENGHDPG